MPAFYTQGMIARLIDIPSECEIKRIELVLFPRLSPCFDIFSKKQNLLAGYRIFIATVRFAAIAAKRKLPRFILPSEIWTIILLHTNTTYIHSSTIRASELRTQYNEEREDIRRARIRQFNDYKSLLRKWQTGI
jgi:hypothetical protein